MSTHHHAPGAPAVVAETEPAQTIAICAGAAGCSAAAVGALASRELLSAPFAVLAVLLVAAAAAAPVLWPTGAAARRRVALVRPVVRTCAAGLVGVLLVRVGGSAGDPEQIVAGIAMIAYPLALLLALQLASAVTLRDVGLVLVESLLAVLLSIGTLGDQTTVDLGSGFAASLLGVWVAGVVTVWLMDVARQRMAATALPGGRRSSVSVPALLVATSVLVGLVTLVVVPEPQGFQPSASPLDRSGVDGSSWSSTRGTLNYLSSTMDLNARGDLPSTELLAVSADSPTLWSANELVTYTGSTWGPPPTQPGPALTRSSDGFVDLTGGRPAPATGSVRQDRVRILDRTAWLPLVFPGQPVGAEVPGYVRPLNGRLLASSQLVDSYGVRSTSEIVDRVADVDTTLPSSVPARVRHLAFRLTRDAPTVEAKVAAIERHLRDTAAYRLDSPVPDPWEDAVDDFLFESQEGFCEHFASAEAVLLRAVGVPARVVTGFAGGEASGDVRVLRGSDAHAWVQVHVGGDRWIWTDPTAGTRLAEDTDLGREVLDFLRRHGVRLLVTLLGAAAVGGLGWLLWRRVRAHRERQRLLAAPLDARVLAAYAAFERALARTSFARRPDVSVADHGRALLATWPGGLPDPARATAALETVQRILYDGALVPPAAARDAVVTLERLTAVAADVLTDRPRHPVG